MKDCIKFIKSEIKESPDNELYSINFNKNIKLVDLRHDNVVKVETMLRYNSSYSQFDYLNKKDSEIYSNVTKELTKYKINNDINYRYSSTFYIKAFKERYYNKKIYEKDNEYKYLLYIILRKINSENSTRTSLDGIKIITQRIFDNFSPSELIKQLQEPFDKNFEYNKCQYKLIDCISKETKQNDNNTRYNFSLASKFCHYMNFNIFDGTSDSIKYQDIFSIYDTVVKDNLKYYYKYYVGKEIPKNIVYLYSKYEIDNNKKNLVEIYRNFQYLIDEIIKSVNCCISRNGFDHLVWYTNKGIRKS